ncbi:unnamed protein product [Enterobius vermicularis]|uniref:CUE domain-containing protein n=1 Tax=Enterobius vermicularis TaxID=51028 RepID=A0A0N4VND7_ENTVE|nr:unnamed protein product [Enterobius vermicularis]
MAAAASSQAPGPSSSSRLTVAERRKMVLLGELPRDFLRLSVPVSPATAQGTVPYVLTTQQVVPLGVTQLAEHNLIQAQQAFYSFVPPNTRGRISITVVEAKLAKNYGLVRMDPYCRVRVGNAVFQTPTNFRGGRAPKWDRIINAYLPNGVESIYIQIYDERAFSNDECVAWAHIVLPSGVFNGEVIDDWYQLSGQQGDAREGVLNLILSFQPVEQNSRTSEVQRPQPKIERLSPGSVRITEEDIKELHNMFQSVDADVIRCILEEKRGDKDGAVNAILEMTTGQ